MMTCLGLIHTRHFGTQYCDKKIILRHRFLLTNQGKLFKKHPLICVLFMYLDLFICQKLTLAFEASMAAQKYLFIAILYVKMSRVNKALGMRSNVF